VRGDDPAEREAGIYYERLADVLQTAAIDRLRGALSSPAGVSPVVALCFSSHRRIDLKRPARLCIDYGMAMHRRNVANYGQSSLEPAVAKRIAIVEDEAAIRDNYAAAFRREGYAVDTYAARGPALDAFDARFPDLVVIDINLKDDVEGGFELCRVLRARAADLPIIFLTARESEFDAVSGLRLGADDYLTKDISLPHLMARVAALFRRVDALKTPQGGDNRITRGDLDIDADRMSIHWQGAPVALTLTEFWLVHAMARYPGHVKNRQQLMDAAQAVLDDNTITSHIKRIRRKFIAIDADFDRIETVYGMGYRWISG